MFSSLNGIRQEHTEPAIPFCCGQRVTSRPERLESGFGLYFARTDKNMIELWTHHQKLRHPESKPPFQAPKASNPTPKP